MEREERNTNCLEGLRCPACASLGPYWIEVTTSIKYYDDGSDEVQGGEWEDESPATCCNCGFCGVVGDLQVEDQVEECKADLVSALQSTVDLLGLMSGRDPDPVVKGQIDKARVALERARRLLPEE